MVVVSAVVVVKRNSDCGDATEPPQSFELTRLAPKHVTIAKLSHSFPKRSEAAAREVNCDSADHKIKNANAIGFLGS